MLCDREAYLQSSQTSAMKLFSENNKQLKHLFNSFTPFSQRNFMFLFSLELATYMVAESRQPKLKTIFKSI